MKVLICLIAWLGSGTLWAAPEISWDQISEGDSAITCRADGLSFTLAKEEKNSTLPYRIMNIRTTRGSSSSDESLRTFMYLYNGKVVVTAIDSRYYQEIGMMQVTAPVPAGVEVDGFLRYRGYAYPSKCSSR